MGRKHKHSKDKLYKTETELSANYRGPNRELELSLLERRLRFDTCCLSLNAATKKPMGLCDEDNFCYVFECDYILKFLQKFNINPITGKRIKPKDLFELKFHRNTDDQYHCPVIYKLFNQHSKIVANKKTGHVYLYEAYHELNLKPSYFRDLLTDEPFDKDEEIVTIQDPALAGTKWKVSEFYHIKNRLKIDDEDTTSTIRDIDQSAVLKSSLEEYKSKADKIMSTFDRIIGGNNTQAKSDSDHTKLDKINSAVYSDGALSSSVTCTIAPIISGQKAALLDEEQILYPRIKKKGYVQMVTNFGPLNLELYCDRTPKTCHNFLKLASRGYYDDTIFHRLIKNFILQGGDPTGTGAGGQSAWGEPFRDECHADLKHEGSGVLAMANSGPNTNKSQFYITLKGVWDHLDGKHTVFGRVVGGYATLERIGNEVEVDKKDRPKSEVKILQITKYVDPFEESEKAIEKERKASEKQSQKDSNTGIGPKEPAKKFRSGVGAYIDLDSLKAPSDNAPKTTGASVGSGVLKRNAMDDGSDKSGPAKQAKRPFVASSLVSLSGKR